MKLFSFSACLLSASSISFGLNAADLINIKDFPSWFQEAMARESNLTETSKLKDISAQTDQSLQLCIHNEMGYRQTFFNVFESFVQAFLENQKNQNFFEVIYQVSTNGAPMGYVHS